MRGIALLVHIVCNPSNRGDPLLFTSVLPSKPRLAPRPIADPMHADMSDLNDTYTTLTLDVPDETGNSKAPDPSTLLDDIQSLRDARSRYAELTKASTQADRDQRTKEYRESILSVLDQQPDQSQLDLKEGDDLYWFPKAAAVYAAYQNPIVGDKGSSDDERNVVARTLIICVREYGLQSLAPYDRILGVRDAILSDTKHQPLDGRTYEELLHIFATKPLHKGDDRRNSGGHCPTV
jgi:hypothetical protein